MSVTSILQNFRNSYLEFFDELIDQFPEETDLIVIRVFFSDQIPVSVIADSFVERILPHKQIIINRNEKFFIENNHMFDMLDGDKVLHFKRLWQSNKLDSDDKNVIWDWFNLFIKLIEQYKNCK